MPVRRARLPATTKIVPATGSEHHDESESGPGLGRARLTVSLAASDRGSESEWQSHSIAAQAA
jgi:hypothetical protein